LNLSPIAFSDTEAEVEPTATDTVKVLPRSVRLVSLLLNGQLIPPEQAKIAFPLDQGQVQRFATGVDCGRRVNGSSGIVAISWSG
jgi:hypothetical protein